ncbi:MAG: hypothetical protein FWC70_00970 [Defluviitaleaceae bacterium]|nr:hypothetical protein [Defluviitaleaceae bacterium]
MKKYILPLLVFLLLTLVTFTGCGRQRPCEPFPEPVIGYFYCPNGINRVQYLQVGPRHFRLADFERFEEHFLGSIYKAFEVDGLLAASGGAYSVEGWVFWRQTDPFFWYLDMRSMLSAQPVTEDCRAELQRARDAFIQEHGDVIYVNIYDFDGVTVLGVMPVSV